MITGKTRLLESCQSSPVACAFSCDFLRHRHMDTFLTLRMAVLQFVYLNYLPSHCYSIRLLYLNIVSLCDRLLINLLFSSILGSSASIIFLRSSCRHNPLKAFIYTALSDRHLLCTQAERLASSIALSSRAHVFYCLVVVLDLHHRILLWLIRKSELSRISVRSSLWNLGPLHHRCDDDLQSYSPTRRAHCICRR